MVVYYDKPGQMRAVRSSNGTDWTDITSQLTAPPKFRHGTVRKLIEPPAVSARVARSRHHKPDGSDSWRLSSGIAVDNSGGKMRVIYSVNGRQCNRIGQFIAVERKAGITQR
jgi:hypothetical protein